MLSENIKKIKDELGITVLEAPRKKIKIWSFEQILESSKIPPDFIVENFLEHGDKAAIIAPPKFGKSFFLSQFAFALATGNPFLGLNVPKPVKVLLTQNEVRDRNYNRRIAIQHERIKPELISPFDDEANEEWALHIKENLKVLHLKNLSIEERWGCINEAIKEFQPDVVILDPMYKLISGDENKTDTMQDFVSRLDQLPGENITVLYSHHDRKGGALGDISKEERGSGSNVLVRDFDVGIFLSAHQDEDHALVLEFINRNSKAPEPLVVRWKYPVFTIDEKLAPIKATRQSMQKRRETGLKEAIYNALRFIETFPTDDISNNSLRNVELKLKGKPVSGIPARCLAFSCKPLYPVKLWEEIKRMLKANSDEFGLEIYQSGRAHKDCFCIRDHEKFNAALEAYKSV